MNTPTTQPRSERGALTGHVMTDAEMSAHDRLLSAGICCIRCADLDTYRAGNLDDPTLPAPHVIAAMSGGSTDPQMGA